jgi:inhibitor of KinA
MDTAMPEKTHDSYQIRPLGDRGLTIELGAAVSATVTARVRMLADRLQEARIPGVREAVPAFCSVTVHYDPLALPDAPGGRIPFEVLSDRLAEVLSHTGDAPVTPGRLVEIPVCYGGECGEDMEALASAHGLSVAAVIELHSAPTYFVGMLGFAPGLPYLAGLDPRLITPRRATPRPRVPRGSVAIGGEHTGIYPLESPGGWQLIGRTPLTLFDLSRDPPSLLVAGDQVRFIPITPADFDLIAKDQAWR